MSKREATALQWSQYRAARARDEKQPQTAPGAAEAATAC